MEQITYFVSNYGYLAIFILLAPGIFGIPLPDELMLTFVGYLALRGDLGLASAIAVVLTGAILGITLDYGVGRVTGAKLIKESGAFFCLGPDRFKRFTEQLHRFGGCALFLGSFVPGVRHWLAIAAGMTNFPLEGFTLFAYAGVLVWSLFYIFLGYFLGQKADILAERIGAYGQTTAGVIATLILGYLLIRGKWLQKWPKISGKLPTIYSLKR